jgi:hypothetical protein
MLERGGELWKQRWPRPDVADLATAAFWIAGLMLAGLAIAHLTRRLRVPVIARPREGLAD